MAWIRFASASFSAQCDMGVPILQRPVCLFALGVIASAVVLACGDECEYGEVQCDGNVARTCTVPESRASWISTDCGSNRCVVAKQRDQTIAFCALAAAPDARCSEADVPNCAGSTLVECTAGYATATRSCADGCRALDDYPDRCVGEAAVDQQRCAASGDQCAMARGPLLDEVVVGALPGGTAGVCSENTLAPMAGYTAYSQRCEGGSIVARTRCGQSCGVLADCSTSCL